MDPDTLDARSLLDVAYCLALDWPAHGQRIDEVLTSPLGPDRETWGETPTATEGARAMEALAGGPARPRQ